MSAAVLRGDARRLPLPDACVDLIMTSPPYFGLRSYTDGGMHYAGQIGSEATPAEWLAALLACTAEWVRVLKPEGSIFVNLGDKYASGGRSTWDTDKKNAGRGKARPQDGYPDKCLLGLPWRYALGCVDQLGLILRAEIIWAKPNGLPESVTDRVRRAHEQVFHLVRQPRYYAAVDEIREPHAQDPKPRGLGVHRGREDLRKGAGSGWTTFADETVKPVFHNPLGKLPGSVWEIPSAPLTVPPRLGISHFAAFPPSLVRPVVLGWSPPGVCAECGQGRRPVVDKALDLDHIQCRFRPGFIDGREPVGNIRGLNAEIRPNRRTVATITGYVCACPTPTAPTRPAVVLDPFGGTGTTALVASVYGRHGISVDLSADYTRLARWRTTDPAERARAMQAPKPPPVPDGQEALFAL